jgi:hypothetical protein
MLFNKVIYLFGNIENDNNDNDKGNGIKECPQEFFNNI